MNKIYAIHAGAWHDASARYIILADGMNIDDEMQAYKGWRTYFPQKHNHNGVYVCSFQDWLLARGAREPDKTELEIIEE